MELRCEGGETVNKTHKESRIKVAITALQKANQRVKAPKGTTTMRLPLEGCTMLLDLVILGEKLHFYIYNGKKSDL